MNITKSIVAIMIIAVATLFISCSSANSETVEKESLLKKQNDSLIQANKDLASLVTIPVEDSTMLQYVQIPDHVKKAWWEYQQAKYATDKEFAIAEGRAVAIKKIAVEKAQQEQKLKNDKADADYNNIEQAACREFAKNSKEILTTIARIENADRLWPYLGSSETYWSFQVDFNFRRQGNEKMPEDFKTMLKICKAADSVRSQTKGYASRNFETQQDIAEQKYDDVVSIARKMSADKINNAYMIYLQKIQ